MKKTDAKNLKQETAAEYTRRVLRNGGRAKKSLGQNFLIDDSVIFRIVEEGIPPGDIPLVEIGPGPGGLTRVLAQKAHRLWAVELDSEKINLLRREFAGAPITFLQADALQVSLADLWGSEKGWLVGNLPYYITNPLLMHFLEQKDSLLGMTVMVQKEVAGRMLANPGGRDYGILSLAVRLFAEGQSLFDVPPSAFWPAPKVTSTVVKLEIRPYPGFTADHRLFFRVVRAAFGQRRKNLLNSLSAGLGMPKGDLQALLQAVGIDGSLRAENLGILEYQRIVEALEK
ncbi:MAG: 16S rRNA (adenine(1518)-N(6)/adenine(1519)-N(6))-dimethyltransferase RsmA [Desulfitobacteriia bacterium]